MKTPIICLLFVNAVFAHYPYQGGNLPMDHRDDIYNRDLPSLVYNFEQLRRDQPPQVEAREEDLGRYMYRPRTTTVAPAKIDLPAKIDFPPEIPEVKILPEPVRPFMTNASTPKPFIGQTWNQIINKHLPATIPPPPVTPKWMDFADTLKNRGAEHPHYSPLQQVSQVPQEVPQKHAEPLTHSVYPQYRDVEYVPTTTTTVAPYAHDMQNVAAEPFVQPSVPKAPTHRSRGNHKFNWNDVTPTESKQQVVIVTTPPSPPKPSPVPQNPPAKINMPSSVPTLTPWSGDNYGK